MKASKTMRYQDKNIDLEKLRADVTAYLQSDGFKIQQPKQNQSQMLIQAQKGGFLREGDADDVAEAVRKVAAAIL